MNREFWKNRRVLITGHTGFKGGWLSLWLHDMGAQVHGYALAPATNPSLFDVADISAIVQSHFHDIRDQNSLSQVIADTEPEIVFHMAAQPLVRQSYIDPLGTLETNVIGTARLLECVRKTDSVKAVVVVTSDKCYLNKEHGRAYREDGALGGHDPYSASKACTELVAQSWQQSFFRAAHRQTKPTCSIATARAGNVIGGGDWSAERLVPDVLQAINDRQPIVLRNPAAVRPWQHVLEPLAGYLLLAEKLWAEGEQWAQAWNFGPQPADSQTVRWIVEKLIAKTGSKNRWLQDHTRQPHEAQMLQLDSSKARDELGWKSVWAIDRCLEEIADWNEHWLLGESMAKVSQRCIERYERALNY